MDFYRLLLSLFTLIVCLPAKAQKPEYPELIRPLSRASDSVLIQNVSVFNGKDSVLLANQDVLIVGNKIVQLAPHSSTKPKGKLLQHLDGTGKFLIPGLIDAHVHLTGNGAVPWEKVKVNVEHNLNAYLFAGVTTVYDLGGLAGKTSKLSERISKQNLTGPHIYNTHIPITVKNSHPVPLTQELFGWPLNKMVNTLTPTLANPSEAPQLMKNYCKQNIDYVKIICDQIPEDSPEMSFEQLQVLITAAHDLGFKAFVHIGSPQNAVDAIRAGADVLAHGIWRGKLSEEQASFIAQSRVPIVYTAAAFQNVNCIHNNIYQPTPEDSLLVPLAIRQPVSGQRGHELLAYPAMSTFFKNVSDNAAHWKTNFNLLQSKGAVIAVGTDSSLPGTYAGSTFLQELETLSKLGLSNLQILSGATYLNAHLFLQNPEFGTIEKGKRADLLLLNANPLNNLSALKHPDLIFVNGRMYERAVK